MGKKSSFHISDEFNENGQKVYLRATTHKKYAPLSQENVRLTPEYVDLLKQVEEPERYINIDGV